MNKEKYNLLLERYKKADAYYNYLASDKATEEDKKKYKQQEHIIDKEMREIMKELSRLLKEIAKEEGKNVEDYTTEQILENGF